MVFAVFDLAIVESPADLGADFRFVAMRNASKIGQKCCHSRELR
jgi:hypothetical protein